MMAIQANQESHEAKIQRLWVTQLYKEHQDISWYHRASLRPVIIQLADMSACWGKWDPLFRTITINLKLIREYPWNIVVEILKHEMAHQYVSEHLSETDSTAHGESFRTACRKLGVTAWAARAAGHLPSKIPDVRERMVSPEDRRLLDRIEKLLSLAQSTNEHEAYLAMQKSRELCAKHNLHKIRENQCDDAMDSVFLTRKKKKTDPTEAKTLSILNDHFKVKVIHTSLFDAESCETFKAAEILGRRENVLMAEHVYYFLGQQCDALWKNYKCDSRVHGSMRRSYQLGILTGFDEKLTAAGSIDRKIVQDAQESPAEIYALQKLDHSVLEEFVGTRYPRLSKKSWGGGRVDEQAFSVGQSAGRRLNLNRPITGCNGFGGYLK